MKWLTYAEDCQQLAKLEQFCSEVIITSKDFSRLSRTPLVETEKMFLDAKFEKCEKIFEWDTLHTQASLSNKIKQFENLPFLSKIQNVRVQDAGVLNYLIKHHPHLSIHLNLENGNHNLQSLKHWSQVSSKISRLILSIEISKEQLKCYRNELKDIEIELLGLGPILLFYTPRNLLSPEFVDHDDDLKIEKSSYMETLAKSEESPHTGFPVVENSHGTFMYHIKDFSLLDRIDEVQKMDINFLRFDHRLHKNFADFPLWSEQYSRKTTRGYFDKNKSDVLFHKLKNYRLLERGKNFIGEVVTSNKQEGTVIWIKNGVLVYGEEILLINPDGQRKLVTLDSIKDSALNSRQKIEKGSLAIIPYQKKFTVKSLVYNNQIA